MTQRSTHAWRALLVLLAVSLCCSRAHADDATRENFGGGVFFGYAFGAHHGFEWGIEAFALHRVTERQCSDQPRAGVGPLLQIAFRDLSEPKLVLAAHGGGELSRVYAAFTGELGLSYRFAPEGGFGIHTGFVAEAAYFNAAFRYEALRNDAWVGAGIRVYPTYGNAMWCD